MDKIEQIRAEIERLRKLLPWGGSASQLAMECNCKNEAYDEILAFIDSLQDEQAGLTNPLFEECLAHVDPDVRRVVRNNMDKVMQGKIGGTFSKFPMIPQDKDSLHIEETCKENEDSFTHSLEEAAWRYENDLWESGFKDCGYSPSEVYEAFREGAKWVRKEMMEGAVECDVYGHCSGWLSFGYVPECEHDFNKGDRVKIIILKGNDTQGNA